MHPSDELSLNNEQRDECLAVLPITLPVEQLDRLVHYIDTYIDRVRNYEPDLANASTARHIYMRDSIAEDDPAWRERSCRC